MPRTAAAAVHLPKVTSELGASDGAEPAAFTADSDRCSTLSRNSGESLIGTASVVQSWLLLEQPGPWEDYAALSSRRLPPGLGAELARRAKQHSVRIVLMRRHGRTPGGAAPTCIVASSSPDNPWLGRIVLDSPCDVLDLDLSTLAAGHVRGVATVTGPLFCVCTHGSHDPCCAERGRPLAAALAADFPLQTWEITHVGGHRFAGNLVCLPDGDYLGRVTADNAVGIARTYIGGDYPLANLRGRSSYTPAVQAADVLVRERLGVARRAAVEITSVELGADFALVRMNILDHGTVEARVGIAQSSTPVVVSCGPTDLEQPPTYDLVALTTVDAP